MCIDESDMIDAKGKTNGWQQQLLLYEDNPQ